MWWIWWERFLLKLASLGDEEGQALTEYTLILALVALTCICALMMLGFAIAMRLNLISVTLSSLGS